MKQNDLIKELFRKYHLQQELPPGSREKMAVLRRETLVAILRSKGKYSLLLVPVLKIFYLSRRIGIPLSMSKSAIAAATALMLATGTVSAGTYYTIRYVQDILRSTEHEKPVIPGQENSNIVPVTPGKAYVRDTVSYQLAIGKFHSSDKTGSTMAERLKRSLIETLNEREAVGKAALLQQIQDNRINEVKYILLGSVIQLENSYRVSARLVEQKTSRIIMYASETVAQKDQLHKATSAIANKIAAAL